MIVIRRAARAVSTGVGDRLFAARGNRAGGRTELRERFVREARTAAGLSHPNIVPIHRVDEAGEFVFFVMAYIDGESLGQRVRELGFLIDAQDEVRGAGGTTPRRADLGGVIATPA